MAKHSVKKVANETIVAPQTAALPEVVKTKVVRKTKAAAAEPVVAEVPKATEEVKNTFTEVTAPQTPADPVEAATGVEAVEPVEPVEPVTKRRNGKVRVYSELFAQIRDDIDAAYKRIQSANRLINNLEAAHNREVSVTKNRENTRRTPTILFDEALVKYYRSKLTGDELKVNHKEGEKKVVVNLADLSGSTRVHRTDVTQLYNLIFKKYNMQDPSDGRIIMYQKDTELVALLTTGIVKPELQADVEAIKAGTFKLTIFNIQRFTNQHLSKFEEPTQEPVTPVV